MIIGHYAAALLPYSRFKHRPFWVLLLCSNLIEFWWMLLALAGIEAPLPASLLDATFQNITVDMRYSHDAVPAVIAAGLTFGVVWAAFKDLGFAGACAGVVALHAVCDVVAGFEHHLMGPQTPSISLGLYHRAPHLAILLEAAFALGCVLWYQHCERSRGRPLTRRKALTLHAVFQLAILVWLPTATRSLRELLG